MKLKLSLFAGILAIGLWTMPAVAGGTQNNQGQNSNSQGQNSQGKSQGNQGQNLDQQ